MKTKTSVNKLGYEETRYLPEVKGNKVFAVDTYVTLCKCIKVEAHDETAAVDAVGDMVAKMLKGCTGAMGAQRLAEEGFEDCDDYETRVSGEANADGKIEYY